MKNLQILDCTLRDGAQANEGQFGAEVIKEIIDNLTCADIDIVECGFLKDCKYEPDRTYYPQPSFALANMSGKQNNVLYAALVDFGRYDIDNLEPYDGKTFDLIRVSFFEKDVDHVKEFLYKVKNKGYKLSIQPMDTFSYSEKNLKSVIEVANEILPEVISMVDTYSLATADDIDRVYKFYESFLNKEIKIGFHSHNNQLNSFALAQHLMEISQNDRDLVIDASLYGMGRGGGNLNTELFAEYLNRQGIKSYKMKYILDMIDKYLVNFKNKFEWGYTMPMMYAGIYGVHVFTAAYLNNKPDVTSFDLKCMFEMLDDHKKKRYDYDYLDSVYEEYMNSKVE